jgi:hypothetical protein
MWKIILVIFLNCCQVKQNIFTEIMASSLFTLFTLSYILNNAEYFRMFN